MKLYNTRSQQVEEFNPQTEFVTIYVCGITPYDTTHLGHAFTYTAADILIRHLEHQGQPVKYVQNVTDIDDDILRKARETGTDWHQLGNEWTAHFIRDMQSLNVRAPDYFPRASDTIPQIIEMVQAMLDAGVAYEADGNVYFAVEAWPTYGELSHLPRAEMLPVANEHGNRPDDPNKRDPLDFVLWQAQVPGEPAWESPWGPGRPGWHIECSAMAMHLLGETIDVHAGGSDLVFPHHESEIAQTVAVTGHEPSVRFWMHTAMVRHEGEKMSKSLGNLVMVRDLLDDYAPDVLRFYLAQHHYRRAWDYEAGELEQAQEKVRVLQKAVTSFGGHGEALDPAPSQAAFAKALDDDLDTRQAAAVLVELAQKIRQAAKQGQQVNDAQDALQALGLVLGLRLDAEATGGNVMAGWNRHLQHFEEPA
ncbi:MAG: cysteine--tRNA ligase [Chloroflexi bacterium]|nr:cysteine--tRNA ligase [Chloroflexota bacterium]